MDPQRAKNILEAALLCSVEPIAVKELMRLFDDAIDASVVTTLLEDLRSQPSLLLLANCNKTRQLSMS